MNEALVLAHGAFHGPWCWRPTIERVEAKGVRCVAVDLNRGGLEADREALQAAVDAILPRDFARNAFYHRCTEEEAEAALDQLRPTFVYGTKPADPPFWEQLPVTYIACSDDRAVQPAYQEAVAARLPLSATLDWDHSPMLGHAEALADVVLEAMRQA